MDTIESYMPTAKQREFHSSTVPQRCFLGGFGSGKSKAGIWEVIDKSMKYPGNRIAILRDTMPSLRDSTMQQFFDECPAEFIYTYKRKDNLVVLRSGSEILFRSFRAYKTSPRNQFESTIKALNLGGYYVDEANEISKEEALLLRGRLRLDTVPWRGGWYTTNPPNKDHWIYELFKAEGHDKKQYHLVEASSRENPHLPEDFISNLEKEYPAAWVKKFIDGEFGYMTAGKPVYDDFRAIDEHGNPWHVRDVKYRAQYGAVHRYWDFGFHHPAVIWAQMTPSGVWKVLRENMGNCIYIEEFGGKIIEESNKHFGGARFLDFCDPAGNQKSDKGKPSVHILKDSYGIRMQYRFSLISEGIDLIAGKLRQVVDGEPALQINEEMCPVTVSGFTGGYCRAAASTGRDMQSSEPIKDGYYEHPHDALRYGAINVFGSHSGAKSKDFPIGGPSWGVSRDVGYPQINGGQGWNERRV